MEATYVRDRNGLLVALYAITDGDTVDAFRDNDPTGEFVAMPALEGFEVHAVRGVAGRSKSADVFGLLDGVAGAFSAIDMRFYDDLDDVQYDISTGEFAMPDWTWETTEARKARSITIPGRR
jgi:hypothetical protein